MEYVILRSPPSKVERHVLVFYEEKLGCRLPETSQKLLLNVVSASRRHLISVFFRSSNDEMLTARCKRRLGVSWPPLPLP